MIKNMAKFEHKVGDRVYQFFCDGDAPLGEVHDALAKFKAHVINVINTSEQKAEEKKELKPE